MVDFVKIKAERAAQAQKHLAAAPSVPVVAAPRDKEDDLSNIADLASTCEDDLSQWEMDFLHSVASYLTGSSRAKLSVKQGKTLDDLVEKYFE